MNVTLYTDASFNPQAATGGWAAWYKRDGASGVVGGPLRMEGPGDHSSTTCELAAIANGAHVLLKRGVLKRGDRLVVVTDSLAAIDLIQRVEFLKATSRRDLRDAPALHAWKVAREAGATLALRHVKAHQYAAGCRRSWVNGVVDAEAKRWRKLAESRIAAGAPAAVQFGTTVLPASFGA